MLLEFFDILRHRLRCRNWDPGLARGRRGEDMAHRYLQSRGYLVVARNYRMSSGEAEADLIAWEGETLVIVEVKTRGNDEFGPPERAVGEAKLAHLRRAGRAYARKTETPWERVRIDLVTVVLSDPPKFELFCNL
jgi:putative endonuclease